MPGCFPDPDIVRYGYYAFFLNRLSLNFEGKTTKKFELTNLPNLLQMQDTRPATHNCMSQESHVSSSQDFTSWCSLTYWGASHIAAIGQALGFEGITPHLRTDESWQTNILGANGNNQNCSWKWLKFWILNSNVVVVVVVEFTVYSGYLILLHWSPWI